MNTADYCPEARELYAEYLALKERSWGLVQVERAVRDALRRWQEHIRDCKACKYPNWKI